MGWTNYFQVYIVGGFSATGGFLFGYHLGVISGVLTMKDFINKSNVTDLKSYGKNSPNGNNSPEIDWHTALIIGIFLFGCFLGSLFGGQTSDRFSRKYSISIFSFLFAISAAIQTFIYANYPHFLIQFLVGRFLAGIAVGALSMIVPIYHSEIASTRIRGRTITLQQWAITIGIGISFWVNVASNAIDNKKNSLEEWQVPLGLQMIPSIILGIGILFCPFSPRWLVCHDREDDAREILMKIRSAPYGEIEEELNRIKNEIVYLRENEIGSYRQLFRTPLLRPLLLGIGIQVFQQLSGINATIYFAPQLFPQLIANNSSRYSPQLISTGVYGTINILFTIPTMIYIDKLGRRLLLISGGIIMFFSLLTVGITDAICELTDSTTNNTLSYCFNPDKPIPWLLTVLIHIFIAGYAFSWGPVPWIYCTEIFPLTMRAKATSLTTAANWIMNLITSILALGLLSQQHYVPFLTFSVICGIMTVLIYFFYPETKDKHLEENNIFNAERLFVPQKFEDKRRKYNRISDQSIVNRTDSPISSEQNSISDLNDRQSSSILAQNVDDFPHKSFDTESF